MIRSIEWNHAATISNLMLLLFRHSLNIVTLKEEPYIIYQDPNPRTGECEHGGVLCRVAPLNITEK